MLGVSDQKVFWLQDAWISFARFIPSVQEALKWMGGILISSYDWWFWAPHDYRYPVVYRRDIRTDHRICLHSLLSFSSSFFFIPLSSTRNLSGIFSFLSFLPLCPHPQERFQSQFCSFVSPLSPFFTFSSPPVSTPHWESQPFPFSAASSSRTFPGGFSHHLLYLQQHRSFPSSCHPPALSLLLRWPFSL